MSRPQSLLLSLPVELRLAIYKHLLAPGHFLGRPLLLCGKSGYSHETGESYPLGNRIICSLSYACSSQAPLLPDTVQGSAQSLNDQSCACSNARNIHFLDTTERLHPSILRTNRQIHDEALPLLYSQHTFFADSVDAPFECERIIDSWFLLQRWLRTLPLSSRNYIRSIRLPIPLLHSKAHGSHESFHAIAALLPRLQTVEIEFRITPPLVSELHPSLDWLSIEPPYFLGPLMAFADAKIVVTAVIREESGGTIQKTIPVSLLARTLEHLVIRIRVQLLAMRRRREERRFRQTWKALRALDYEDVDGWVEEEKMLDDKGSILVKGLHRKTLTENTNATNGNPMEIANVTEEV